LVLFAGEYLDSKMTSMGQLAFDEFGRPFLILKDEESQTRLTGSDAIKSHIIGRTSVADPDPGSCAFVTPGSGIRDG
jgi:hypothetical protein